MGTNEGASAVRYHRKPLVNAHLSVPRGAAGLTMCSRQHVHEPGRGDSSRPITSLDLGRPQIRVACWRSHSSMDRAPVYGTGGSRFDPWWDRMMAFAHAPFSLS